MSSVLPIGLQDKLHGWQSGLRTSKEVSGNAKITEKKSEPLKNCGCRFFFVEGRI